jgi:hypothetical protein
MSLDASNELDTVWRELVSAALLGTDRRPPPIPRGGPVGDLVADAVRPDDASRMLAAVGAVAAARRAGFVAGAAAPALQPPADDVRPWCSPGAVATWRTIVAEWPVLEDEWVLTVIEQGIRVPPEAVADLLLRHRGDAVRRARADAAAGPVAAWLTDHVPALAPTTGRSAPADAVATLPVLPVPAELAELLTIDSHLFVKRLMPGFEAQQYGPAHKAVLINLLARCRPAVLLDAARALDHQRVGLALALADLARLRHRMLTELGVAV